VTANIPNDPEATPTTPASSRLPLKKARFRRVRVDMHWPPLFCGGKFRFPLVALLMTDQPPRKNSACGASPIP